MNDAAAPPAPAADAPNVDRSAPLAVRHRPRRFADVVGQRAVRAALAAAVRAGEPPRQLMLSGGSGLGKTTIARIFAAALLCEDPPGDGDSCGVCGSCVAVWDTSEPHPDVIEMDAASNGGKEEIAALAQRVTLAPLRGAWKVFIVDEAHGITRAGAEAFLKLLEEPPPHVIFVLATTEAHKMLPTIRGRCVELGFTAPTAAELTSHVAAVAAAEGWDISAAVAEAVVDSVGDGLGVRGALSALGRISGLFAAGAIDDDTVAELLGAAPHTAVAELTAAIVAGDLPEVYRLTAALTGRYPATEVRRVLIRQLRDALIAAEPGGAAAAARRLAAIAEVPDGLTWLEVAVARATVAALDGAEGLTELCERAEAAAARLTEALSAVEASTGAAATTTAATAAHPEPDPAGEATPGPEPTGAGHRDPGTRTRTEDTPGEGAATPAAGVPVQTADEAPHVSDGGGTPPHSGDGAAAVHFDDAPPHSDADEPGAEEPTDTGGAPWENDPWFTEQLTPAAAPVGTGTASATKRAPRKPAPKKKAPAKKAPAKKAPAKKSPAQAAGKVPPARAQGDGAPAGTLRRRTGAPAAALDVSRLSAIVAARDPLAARILEQCATRNDGTELTVVVPVKLAEGLRARPELRDVIDAAAAALGVTATHWKVSRGTGGR